MTLQQTLRAARSHRTNRKQPSRPRSTALVLEELERREMPSASGWEAQPNVAMTPLAGTGSTVVYSPAQIRHAYGFDRLPFDGAGQTIALIVAYDDPNVWSDLVRFDRTFNLPDPPSFVKATPQGMPSANAAWASEIALDVEWSHAIAPRANILLVEARSASATDLLTAVDYARNYQGVSVVSMSWGGPEFFNEANLESHFTTPTNHLVAGRPGGITFVASAGDSGAWYGPDWPSVSPRVLAVGGTSLYLTGGAYAAEVGWGGSGGGYSRYIAEPTYQNGVQHTARRSSPDVGYDADTATGVYVFNSYALPAGYSGWYSFGGTSAGAPQWAGLLALADQGRSWSGLGSIANAQSTIYALPASDFHTISGGYNGYAVTSGYNPVTGRGSPVGDLVVWGLISSGSSTLTVGNSSGKSTTGGTTTKPQLFAAALGGDGPAVYAITFETAALSILPAAVQTNDAVFAPRKDFTDHLLAPAFTATDGVLWNFAPLRLFGARTEADQSLLDLALFGNGVSE